MAARALESIKAEATPAAAQKEALDYPQPRVALGRSLLGLATSCIDLSDGLASDLAHILDRSGVGAEVELGRLPASEDLCELQDEHRWRLQLAGGDDYELCFTVPPESARRLEQISESCNIPLTVIGRIVDQGGLQIKSHDGVPFEPGPTGYVHFAGRGGSA